MKGFRDDRKLLMAQPHPQGLLDDIKDKSLSQVCSNSFSFIHFIVTVENIFNFRSPVNQFNLKGRFGGRDQIAQWKLKLQTDIDAIYNDFVSCFSIDPLCFRVNFR